MLLNEQVRWCFLLLILIGWQNDDEWRIQTRPFMNTLFEDEHIYLGTRYIGNRDCIIRKSGSKFDWNKGTESIMHISASVLLSCCRKVSFKQSIDRRLVARSTVCLINYLFDQLFRKIDSRMMFWKQKVNTEVSRNTTFIIRFTIKYFYSK